MNTLHATRTSGPICFAQSRWHPSKNGSTYVVTGVNKTSNCSTMAFQVRLNSPAKIIARYRNKALFALYGLSAVRNAIKPKAMTPPSRSLCAFFREIRIGVGRAEWIENTEERPDNADPTPSFISHHLGLLSNPSSTLGPVIKATTCLLSPLSP